MKQCFACGTTEGVARIVAGGHLLYACTVHQGLARKVAKHEGQPVTPGTRTSNRKVGRSAPRRSEPARSTDRNGKRDGKRPPFRGKPTPRKMVKAAQSLLREVVRQEQRGATLSIEAARAAEDLRAACEEWTAKRLTAGVLEQYNRSGAVLGRWLEGLKE